LEEVNTIVKNNYPELLLWNIILLLNIHWKFFIF
jgi:hypothetical protein